MLLDRQTTEVQQMLEIIRDALRWKWFPYIDLAEAKLLHFVNLGSGGFVAVIGDPDNASYEWVARSPDPFDPMPADFKPDWRWSNQGYGSSVGALRDALNAVDA